MLQYVAVNCGVMLLALPNVRKSRTIVRIMRTSSLMDALMPGTRQRLLAATLLRPEKAWYLRELAEFLHVSPSSIQRELAGLTSAGILKKRTDGNRTYFRADPNCPILPQLQEILIKTVGVVDLLRDQLQPLAKNISAAFIYGSIAAGSEGSESDIDLMVIGTVGLSEISLAVREAEDKLGRAINPVILSSTEAWRKLKQKQHFIETVRTGPKLFLIDKDHELAEAFKR